MLKIVLTLVFFIALQFNFAFASSGGIPQDVVSGLKYVVENPEVDTQIIYDPYVVGSQKAIEYSRDRNNSSLKIKFNDFSASDVVVSDGKVTVYFKEKIADISLFDTTNLNQNPNDRMVDSFNYSPELKEFTIYLKNNVDVTYNTNFGELVFNFVKRKSAVPKIVIDPGHGGKDPGATSIITKAREKDIALRTALSLKDKLINMGYNVVMTRDSDFYPTLIERATLANDLDADIFISVHYNSVNSNTKNIHGIETYAFNTPDNKMLGENIHSSLISNTKAFNRGVKSGNKLVVLNRTKVPAVLLELGFLSHPSDAVKVMRDDYQELLTDSIVQGVNHYFGR